MRTWQRTSLVSISFASSEKTKTIFKNRKGREGSTSKAPALDLLSFRAVTSVFQQPKHNSTHSDQFLLHNLFQHRKVSRKPGIISESNLDLVVNNSDGNPSDFPQTPQSRCHGRSSTAAWCCTQERDSPVGEGPSGTWEPKTNRGAALWVLAALTSVLQLDLGGEGEQLYSSLKPLLGVCLSAVTQEQHRRTDASPLWVRCCQTRPLSLPYHPSARVQPVDGLPTSPSQAGWLPWHGRPQ